MSRDPHYTFHPGRGRKAAVMEVTTDITYRLWRSLEWMIILVDSIIVSSTEIIKKLMIMRRWMRRENKEEK